MNNIALVFPILVSALLRPSFFFPLFPSSHTPNFISQGTRSSTPICLAHSFLDARSGDGERGWPECAGCKIQTEWEEGESRRILGVRNRTSQLFPSSSSPSLRNPTKRNKLMKGISMRKRYCPKMRCGDLGLKQYFIWKEPERNEKQETARLRERTMKKIDDL